MQPDQPSADKPAAVSPLRAVIDGFRSLDLERTHIVPQHLVAAFLILALPVGYGMDQLLQLHVRHPDAGLLISFPASYVTGLASLTEEPYRGSLQDMFWTGLAVILPLWLILRGAVMLAAFLSGRR